MLNRNPVDLACAYGDTSRKNVSKAQENKGKVRGTTLRGCGPKTLQGAQVRDCSKGRKGLVPSLQLGVGETPACNGRSHHDHALKVVQVTVVERERPFVHVANGVLRSVVGLGALPSALVEGPEVLDPIGVNVAIHVFASSVINREVPIIPVKADVGRCLVRVYGCTGLYPSTNACLNGLSRDRFDHSCYDRTAALQCAMDGDLVGSPSSANLALAVHDVHVLGEAAM